MNDWLSITDAYRKEAELRNDINPDALCTYGIRPLDDALYRIGRNELVVIGADSAGGKTELCLQIARENLLKGKRIALYHLEGGWKEAISRMKWRDISDEYFKNHSHLKIDMDFRRWQLNQLKDAELNKIENEVWERYKNIYKDNLMFYSSSQGLSIVSFLQSLIEFVNFPRTLEAGIDHTYDLDLIIIDHLQYFSLTKEENEISEITKILREVKNITDNFGVPVVLISHLRKKGKDRGLPDQEDFYGSSNITKIASTAITLCPASKGEDLHNGLFPTWMRIVKSRIGIRPNYAMLINFDQKTKSYEDKYKIYKLDSFGNPATESLNYEEFPKWARGGYWDERYT